MSGDRVEFYHSKGSTFARYGDRVFRVMKDRELERIARKSEVWADLRQAASDDDRRQWLVALMQSLPIVAAFVGKHGRLVAWQGTPGEIIRLRIVHDYHITHAIAAKIATAIIEYKPGQVNLTLCPLPGGDQMMILPLVSEGTKYERG